MFCTSRKAIKADVPQGPAKPPKPAVESSVTTKAADEDAPKPPPKPKSMRLEAPPEETPVAPPKPRSLQGRDTIGKEKTREDYRDAEDKKLIHSMAGPSKGPGCITVPTAKEEVSKDGSEKYWVFNIIVKLPSNKNATCKKRFSEFATFHKDWRAEYPGVNVEMPKKQMSLSDEDVARRCVELQVYLRELCEVSALIYLVSKFLGVEEADLKAAVKGRSNTVSDSPASSSGGGSKGNGSSRNLPKVALNDDNNRSSVEKPKLPRVKLGDVENGQDRQSSSNGAATPPRAATPPSESAPPPAKSAPRIVELNKENQNPPSPAAAPATPRATTPAAAPPIPSSRDSAKKEEPKKFQSASPATAAKSSTPVKSSTPTSSSNNNSKSAAAAPPASSAGGRANGERTMSVKERMAAFQKN